MKKCIRSSYPLSLLSLTIAFLTFPYSEKISMAETSRYSLMDADNSHSLSFEEFRSANPNLTKAAFDIIDKNKDNILSQEEWEGFMGMHSKPDGLELQNAVQSTLPAQDAPVMPQVPAPKAPLEPSVPNQANKLEQTKMPVNLNQLPATIPPAMQKALDEKGITIQGMQQMQQVQEPEKIKTPASPTMPSVNAPVAPAINQVQQPSNGNLPRLGSPSSISKPSSPNEVAETSEQEFLEVEKVEDDPVKKPNSNSIPQTKVTESGLPRFILQESAIEKNKDNSSNLSGQQSSSQQSSSQKTPTLTPPSSTSIPQTKATESGLPRFIPIN